MANPIDMVLGKLDGVMCSGKNMKALCPAHGDKTPSLSIKEGEDGRVLLHCFSGCPVEEIVAAMGLKMTDIFSVDVNKRHSSKVPGVSVRQLSLATENERQILYFAKADQMAGRVISQSDMERTKLAFNRIAMARKII